MYDIIRPEAILETDADGNTVLITALQECCGASVALKLIAACPDAVKVKAVDAFKVFAESGRFVVLNSTPLHVALQTMDTPVVVSLALIAAWPDGVKEKDANGDTPFKLVVQKKDIPDAVRLAVIKAWSMPPLSRARTRPLVRWTNL